MRFLDLRILHLVGFAFEGVEDDVVEERGVGASIDCSWRLRKDHIGENALLG